MEPSPQHSSALLHAILRQHQLESTVEADDVQHRSIAPIWDLLALDASPDVSRNSVETRPGPR